jgi:hypothetical protein
MFTRNSPHSAPGILAGCYNPQPCEAQNCCQSSPIPLLSTLELPISICILASFVSSVDATIGEHLLHHPVTSFFIAVHYFYSTLPARSSSCLHESHGRSASEVRARHIPMSFQTKLSNCWLCITTDHCTVRGFSEPAWQDLSDRRGMLFCLFTALRLMELRRPNCMVQRCKRPRPKSSGALLVRWCLYGAS